MSVLTILNELASDSSKNFKLEVLKREADNYDLREFFRLALDKSLNFYIKKIPKYSKRHTGETNLGDAMISLNKLARRVFTGNRAKFFVSKLLTECSEEDAEVVSRILKRDPNCKVAVGSVNKTWPGLIKVWPCMLCERSTRKNLDNIRYPAVIQEKADGLRFNILHVDGEIEYRGRSGKFIQLHGVLDDQVRELAKHIPVDDFVIDGEGLIGKMAHISTPSNLWTKYADGDLFEDRRTGNGIFNKAIKNTITKEEAKQIKAKVWDVIPYEEFVSESGRGTTQYGGRLKVINRALKRAQNTVTDIGMSLTKLVFTEREALDFYKRMLEEGKEGAILKNLHGVWESPSASHRSKDQVKLKVVKQIEMRVVATYPHKKRKNWIGGLTIESECGKVRNNCGSGLKEKDRKKPPSWYMGNIVMTESNGLVTTKDAKEGDGEFSLYLPIFKEVRIDKDVADTHEDIVEIFDSI